MGRFASIGLVLMWLNGLMLAALKYGGFAGLPGLFWVKIIFVSSLTIAAIRLELTYAQVKRGDTGAAKRLPGLGAIAGASSLLAVLFAVLSSH